MCAQNLLSHHVYSLVSFIWRKFRQTEAFNWSNSPLTIIRVHHIYEVTGSKVSNGMKLGSKVFVVFAASVTILMMTLNFDGGEKKVVVYSFLGNISDRSIYHKYFSQIHMRNLEIRKLYPGFKMRVYTNLSAFSSQDLITFDSLQSLQNLEVCDINKQVHSIRGISVLTVKVVRLKLLIFRSPWANMEIFGHAGQEY